MKIVISDIVNVLRWAISLGNKLFHVVPGHTVLAAISSVLSQFFLLASFLLPLKVVLLLGSDNVPGYFPGIMQELGRDGLVVILSITSVCFYLAHLVTSKIVEISAANGSNHLLAKSKKMILFENQQEIALRGYQRYTQSLATIGFVAICLFVMTAFYTKIALLIIGYTLICVVMAALMTSFFETFQNRIYDDPGAIAKLLGGIGFLISFGFIVVDHLMGSAPGLLVSVISLLLARQSFSRMADLVRDLKGLYGRKSQLAALFFHGHVYHQRQTGNYQGIWTLVEPVFRDQWIKELLFNIERQEIKDLETLWMDLGGPNVLCYQVTYRCKEDMKVLLIKLFNSNRSVWAKHEASLVTNQSNLPMIPLITVSMVEGFHCHVFDVSELNRCSKSDTSKILPSFNARLSLCVPDKALVAVSVRSRPQIWQRLDKELIQRMQHLLDSKAEALLMDQFRGILPGIHNILSQLPMTINVPGIRPSMLWKNSDGDCFLAHWVRWELEPLGAGWPFSLSESERLQQLFQEAKDKRIDAKNLKLSHVRLSALFSEFETRLQRGGYAEAYTLIPQLIQEYDSI